MAWPINACWARLGFAPHGRVTFSCLPKRKSPKRRAPRHPGFAARNFPRSGTVPRVVTVGRPWPIVPHLASMPNAPLHSTYARPPDGAEPASSARSLCKARSLCVGFGLLPWLFNRNLTGGGQISMQKAEGNRCARARAAWTAARGITGQGWPVMPAPGAAMERGKRSAAE